jgi:hypothetical protein
MAVLVLVSGLAMVPIAGSDEGIVEYSDISGREDEPRRHLRVVDPARLEPGEAEIIYRDLLPEMSAGYGPAGGVGAVYGTWERFNTAPYRSATHGRHYVDNYANAIAAEFYRRYEAAGTLPVGSIVAKDSFIVTADRLVEPGPLFVMEKMSEGFNYVTGDWRYKLISADGELVGETRGEGAERVEYCIACHAAAAIQGTDHLFFVPKDLRVP